MRPVGWLLGNLRKWAEGAVKDDLCNGQTPQPAPQPNELPAVWDLVISDMRARDCFGQQKYQTRLQPNNGRDALIDLYQELLDACFYARQMIFERDGA